MGFLAKGVSPLLLSLEGSEEEGLAIVTYTATLTEYFKQRNSQVFPPSLVPGG